MVLCATDRPLGNESTFSPMLYHKTKTFTCHGKSYMILDDKKAKTEKKDAAEKDSTVVASQTVRLLYGYI